MSDSGTTTRPSSADGYEPSAGLEHAVHLVMDSMFSSGALMEHKSKGLEKAIACTIPRILQDCPDGDEWIMQGGRWLNRFVIERTHFGKPRFTESDVEAHDISEYECRARSLSYVIGGSFGGCYKLYERADFCTYNDPTQLQVRGSHSATTIVGEDATHASHAQHYECVACRVQIETIQKSIRDRAQGSPSAPPVVVPRDSALYDQDGVRPVNTEIPNARTFFDLNGNTSSAASSSSSNTFVDNVRVVPMYNDDNDDGDGGIHDGDNHHDASRSDPRNKHRASRGRIMSETIVRNDADGHPHGWVLRQCIHFDDIPMDEIPCPKRSSFCHTTHTTAPMNECPLDPGYSYLVKGTDKYIVSQVERRRDFPYVKTTHSSKTSSIKYECELRTGVEHTGRITSSCHFVMNGDPVWKASTVDGYLPGDGLDYLQYPSKWSRWSHHIAAREWFLSSGLRTPHPSENTNASTNTPVAQYTNLRRRAALMQFPQLFLSRERQVVTATVSVSGVSDVFALSLSATLFLFGVDTLREMIEICCEGVHDMYMRAEIAQMLMWQPFFDTELGAEQDRVMNTILEHQIHTGTCNESAFLVRTFADAQHASETTDPENAHAVASSGFARYECTHWTRPRLLVFLGRYALKQKDDFDKTFLMPIHKLNHEFLPHLGTDDSTHTHRLKVHFLAHIIRKLVACRLEKLHPDDEDHLNNKRILTDGPLLCKLYAQATRDNKKLFRRTVNDFILHQIKLTEDGASSSSSAAACMATDASDAISSATSTTFKSKAKRKHHALSRGTDVHVPDGPQSAYRQPYQHGVVPDIPLGPMLSKCFSKRSLTLAVYKGSWTTLKGATKAPTDICFPYQPMTSTAALGAHRKLSIPLGDESKTRKPRRFNLNHEGIICPAQTPDDTKVGLVIHMAMGATTRIGMERGMILPIVLAATAQYGDGSHKLLVDTRMTRAQSHNRHLGVEVQVNNATVGYTRHPQSLLRYLRTCRRVLSLPRDCTIAWVNGPVLDLQDTAASSLLTQTSDNGQDAHWTLRETYDNSSLFRPHHHYISISANDGATLQRLFVVHNLWKLPILVKQFYRQYQLSVPSELINGDTHLNVDDLDWFSIMHAYCTNSNAATDSMQTPRDAATHAHVRIIFEKMDFWDALHDHGVVEHLETEESKTMRICDSIHELLQDAHTCAWLATHDHNGRVGNQSPQAWPDAIAMLRACTVDRKHVPLLNLPAVDHGIHDMASDALARRVAQSSATLPENGHDLQHILSGQWTRLLRSPRDHRPWDGREAFHRSNVVMEQSHAMPSVFTHVRIHPSLIYGVGGSELVAPEHTPAARAQFFTNMSTQMPSHLALNRRYRLDTAFSTDLTSHRAMLPKMTDAIMHPYGLGTGTVVLNNSLFAHPFVTEDATVHSSHVNDLGFGRTLIHRTMRLECTGRGKETNIFAKPNIDNHMTLGLKDASYRALQANGMPILGATIDSGTVAVGMVMTPTEQQVMPMEIDLSVLQPGAALPPHDTAPHATEPRTDPVQKESLIPLSKSNASSSPTVVPKNQPKSKARKQSSILDTMTDSLVRQQQLTRDMSAMSPFREPCTVYSVLITRSSDGGDMVKIGLRSVRSLHNGDKTTNEHGQKGVVALIQHVAGMVYVMCPRSGRMIPLDYLRTPNCMPSRMTLGEHVQAEMHTQAVWLPQLHYCRTHPKTSHHSDNTHKMRRVHDRPTMDAFENPSSGRRHVALSRMGRHAHDEHRGMSAVLGTMFVEPIVVAMLPFRKLKQMATDKTNVRARGNIILSTHQPQKGRTRGGGGKDGSMEVDVVTAMGSTQILKQIMNHASDPYYFLCCVVCGGHSEPPPSTLANQYVGSVLSTVGSYCRHCRAFDTTVLVELPYIGFLTVTELRSQNTPVAYRFTQREVARALGPYRASLLGVPKSIIAACHDTNQALHCEQRPLTPTPSINVAHSNVQTSLGERTSTVGCDDMMDEECTQTPPPPWNVVQYWLDHAHVQWQHAIRQQQDDLADLQNADDHDVRSHPTNPCTPQYQSPTTNRNHPDHAYLQQRRHDAMHSPNGMASPRYNATTSPNYAPYSPNHPTDALSYPAPAYMPRQQSYYGSMRAQSPMAQRQPDQIDRVPLPMPHYDVVHRSPPAHTPNAHGFSETMDDLEGLVQWLEQ